ncbi:hypothetical protein SpCBS45565_g05212 [Spizellomyces sp. 'palustris']|nr:hypothetical protein SpCBS45565_g05212 [Spizellomyces sp. 'palustris']
MFEDMQNIKTEHQAADAPENPTQSAESSLHNDPRVRYIEETSKYVYTGDDGISYEWDDEKHAWFPMWDENLIESQQAAYGPTITEETTSTSRQKGKRKQIYTSEEPQVKKPKAEPKKRPNTSVYVTGLPRDTTVDEMKEVFGKYGILMEDLATGQPKIKLYKDERGNLKGDALVSYFKEESVDLACNLLDDSDFRLGVPSKIRVQKAVFQAKEKPPNSETEQPDQKVKLDKKVVQKKRQKLEKRLDWFEEQSGKKADKFARVVVLKYMFTLQELELDPTLLLDLKEDVRGECEKLGEVTNVSLYDLEEDGIMTVRFKEPESAELCIKKMHGRFFAGRRVEAHIMQGKEKYRESKSQDQTEEEEKKRLEAYETWLESQH